jgi:hypothetical protein
MTVAEYVKLLLAMPDQSVQVVTRDGDGDMCEALGPDPLNLHMQTSTIKSQSLYDFSWCSGSHCGLCAQPEKWPLVGVVEIS